MTVSLLSVSIALVYEPPVVRRPYHGKHSFMKAPLIYAGKDGSEEFDMLHKPEVVEHL